MGRIGNEQHEKLLKNTIDELEYNGYKVIELKGKSPDAIAIKDNKVIAVEILGESWTKKKGWHKSWTITQKEDNYNMFDEVLIKTFKRNQKPEE